MNRNVVIIGAGKSGRGDIGELYDAEGYHITFADRDGALVNKLREQERYTVYKISEDGSEEKRIISGYQAVHTRTEQERYMDALLEAEYISTATYPDGFDAIIEDIAKLIRLRMKKGLTFPVAITLGANYVGLRDYFAGKLDKLLADDEKQHLKQYIGLVESIIYRASSYPTEEQAAEDALAVQGDDWPYLQVERNAFVFPKDKILPGFFCPEDGITRQMMLKIWIGNTLHCSLAFLGRYYGLDYTYQSTRHDYVSRCSYYASQEGYTALAKKFGMPLERDKKELREVWEYYRNPSIHDSLLRVAADPIRKLGRNERFIGPALLSMELGDVPAFICHNAAYGFVYRNENDPSSVKLQQMIADKGIERTIRDVCQLNTEDENEKIICQLILASYKEIVKENPVDSI